MFHQPRTLKCTMKRCSDPDILHVTKIFTKIIILVEAELKIDEKSGPNVSHHKLNDTANMSKFISLLL